MRILRWLSLAVLLTVVPALAAAQQDPAAAARYPENRIYVGMVTAHLRHITQGISKRLLLGASWHGIFGGTFINSFGDRSFAMGVQRTVARGADAAWVPTFGFRLGLVTGYDERFIALAAKTPFLPLLQLLGGLDHGRTGLEMSWSGLVTSVTPRFRF